MELVPASDWIFFSSKKAVHYFFDQSAPAGLPRLAAIGPGTAAALAAASGRAIEFSGNGDPGTTATLFAAQADGQTVLFPGAQKSRRSIQRLLEGRIHVLDLPVYKSTPLTNPPQIDADVLVWTSPLNALSYFSHHDLLPGQRLIAIGEPTAEQLRGMGYAQIICAEMTSEDSLVAAVLSL